MIMEEGTLEYWAAMNEHRSEMNTEKAIQLICRLMIENGKNFAVLRGAERFRNVDWAMVAIFFNTDEIHGYSMTDKIIIEVMESG